MSIGQVEIFLIQLIVYTGVYLLDPYIGLLLCIVIACISFALLVLSWIFEWIDKSKVPRAYYWFMINATIAPVLVMLVFSLLVKGSFNWMAD